MLKPRSLALAAASLFVTLTSRAQYADAVLAYTSGSGVTAGYTEPSRALGAPTIFIGYQNADPFNPPYSSNHLVSIGTGGSLTVQFNTPILNNPNHAFGLDFIVFGNAGFIITNGNYSGGGITDGSLFANNAGITRVSVSADNTSYYTLNPSLAPVVDGLFPPDANGDFSLPVNPALSSGDFVGKDLAGIRSLYAGSGGGTGFDISWAQDGNGQNVFLPGISYIRVDVLSGKSEIDALSIVPEPASGALALLGAGLLLWARRRKTSRLCA
jgi:hypothetical protein